MGYSRGAGGSWAGRCHCNHFLPDTPNICLCTQQCRWRGEIHLRRPQSSVGKWTPRIPALQQPSSAPHRHQHLLNAQAQVREAAARSDSAAPPHPSQQKVRAEDTRLGNREGWAPRKAEPPSSERRRGAASRCLQPICPSTLREFLERAQFS